MGRNHSRMIGYIGEVNGDEASSSNHLRIGSNPTNVMRVLEGSDANTCFTCANNSRICYLFSYALTITLVAVKLQERSVITHTFCRHIGY